MTIMVGNIVVEPRVLRERILAARHVAAHNIARGVAATTRSIGMSARFIARHLLCWMVFLGCFVIAGAIIFGFYALVVWTAGISSVLCIIIFLLFWVLVLRLFTAFIKGGIASFVRYVQDVKEGRI